MRKSLLGAGAWLLLSAMAAHAASPDQLYQTWQKSYLRDPETAEKAAQDYLHAAPQGPYAADLQIWLDAYHKAMASILSQPRSANKGAPSNKQASAQPAPPPAAQPPAPPPKFVAQQKPPKPAALNPAAALPVRRPKPATVQPKQPTGPVVNLAAATPVLVPPKPPQPVKPAAVPSLPVQSAPATRSQARPETRLASAEPISQKPSPKLLPNDVSAHPAGQSLDQALAFIADKVDDQDALTFTAESFNAAGGALVERLSYLASNVTIDPNRCEVSYRWHVQQDGRSTPDQDRAVQLRLSRAITVETIEQALADLNAGRFRVHVHPELYAVHVARWDRPAGDNLYFRDRGMAESVAAAAQHALDLCDKQGR